MKRVDRVEEASEAGSSTQLDGKPKIAFGLSTRKEGYEKAEAKCYSSVGGMRAAVLNICEPAITTGNAQEQRFGFLGKAPATVRELKPDVVSLMTLPERLWVILMGGDVNSAMWWLPDGDCFCLVSATFELVLDRHFHGTKMESFTRKLNRW